MGALEIYNLAIPDGEGEDLSFSGRANFDPVKKDHHHLIS